MPGGKENIGKLFLSRRSIKIRVQIGKKWFLFKNSTFHNNNFKQWVKFIFTLTCVMGVWGGEEEEKRKEGGMKVEVDPRTVVATASNAPPPYKSWHNTTQSVQGCFLSTKGLLRRYAPLTVTAFTFHSYPSNVFQESRLAFFQLSDPPAQENKRKVHSWACQVDRTI